MGLRPREHPFDAGSQGLHQRQPFGSCCMVRELLRPGVPLIDDVGNVPNAGAEGDCCISLSHGGGRWHTFCFYLSWVLIPYPENMYSYVFACIYIFCLRLNRTIDVLVVHRYTSSESFGGSHSKHHMLAAALVALYGTRKSAASGFDETASNTAAVVLLRPRLCSRSRRPGIRWATTFCPH